MQFDYSKLSQSSSSVLYYLKRSNHNVQQHTVKDANILIKIHLTNNIMTRDVRTQ